MRRPTSLVAGYTLVEMIIYVVILSLLSLVLISSVLVVMRSFTRVRAVRDLAESGGGAMERIVREIRQARAINVAGSTFGTSPGRLELATTDAAGDPTTLTLALSGTNLTIQEGAGAPSNLLAGHLAVSSLIFRQWATSTASSVKVELALTDDRLPGAPPTNFYTTVVLRGSY